MTRDDVDADVVKAVRRAAWTRQAFYALVLAVALIGQVTGAAQTLGVPLIIAVPAVATLELGGVVLMADADVRRRLGERALASRLLSATIAASAAAFNWAAHPDHLLGGFYAAMSALGYLVWLIHAGNQRRDRLRATGNLPPTPPAYEVIGHWLRHPAITLRARTIAKADGLDLYDSLRHARAAIERERRNAAIAKVLHRKIRAALDTTTADIAVRVYDLDEVADRLTATADYTEITNLLATDLTPKRIITADSTNCRRWLNREGHAPRLGHLSHVRFRRHRPAGSRRKRQLMSSRSRNQSQTEAQSPIPRTTSPCKPRVAAASHRRPCPRRTKRPPRKAEMLLATMRSRTSPGRPGRRWPTGCAENRTSSLNESPRESENLCARSTATCHRTTQDDRESPGNGHGDTPAPRDRTASASDVNGCPQPTRQRERDRSLTQGPQVS
ncbi:hypothetical protein ACQP0I_04170 [Micromonospora carbonacea]|uniref:hypothetical protein n=1 Tax=Micromonospora carbonacea TaxID=47853 RepID=UPI003D960326